MRQRVVRDHPGSQRHAAHEDGEHQGLRVGGMAQEEFQVVRPDGFVNQSGEPGDDEYAQQKSAASTLAVASPVGSRPGAAFWRAGHVA